MNKIYKVIWNATLCTWVAVSELAKGKTKSSKVTKIVGAATVAAMSIAPAMAQSQLPLDSSGNLNIGDNNVVTTIDSYVIGANNEVLYRDTFVAGNRNKASARSFETVVLGTQNNVDGDRNVVLGAMNTTSGNRSTAIGMENNVSGYRSTAVGQNNTVTKQGLALGTSNSSEGENSAAIGHNSAAFGNKTIAMGDNARAFGGEGAIALGAGSRAYNANDIALGSNSGTGTAMAIGTAGVTLNGTNYAFAGTTPKGILSIGRADFERTITNVAAGRVSATSTDGINGSQLHATNLALADLNDGAVKYDRNLDGSVNKGKIALEGAISTDGGATGGTKITNLAQGAVNDGSTDAINGSQLYATNQNVATNATNIANNSTNITNLQNQTFKLQANGDVASAVKSSDTVQFLNGENINITRNGNDITVATAKAVAFDKVTVGNVVVDKTTNKITGIEAGTDTNDAVNKGQLDAVIADQAAADALNVKYDSTTKDKVTLGGAGSTTPVQVSNVKAGDLSATSTDAVNGSQLYALGDNITNIFGGNANYANNQIIWTNIGGTGKDTIDEAIQYVNNQATNANQGWKVITDSGTAATSTVKPGDIVNIKGDTASGVTVTNSGNDITVGLGDQITVGTGANAVSIDGNGGTIQVGDINIDGTTNTITAGKVSLNGDSGTVNGLTNITWNPADIVSGQAATEDQLKQVADNAAQAAAAAKSTVTEGENVTVTQSKNADGSTNYQVATKKDVTFDSVTSGSVSADKVIVGNVVIDQAGISAGGNKVSNLADGTISSTSKDAINGSQLHASNTNIYNYLGGGANYETNTGPTYNVGGGSHNNVGDALDALDDRDTQLDNKITNLGDQLQQAFYTTNERIDGVEKRANAGIAAAMALETAPYVAGKWTYAAATAYHGGENAVGVTLRKTADNGRWSLTGGIAAASEGDPSFRIGISGVID